MNRKFACLALVCTGLCAGAAYADENLFSYVKGAEPLPKGALEFYQQFTVRNNKGVGTYKALDLSTELERGITDRLAAAVYLNGMGIETEGLTIDGYLPKPIDYNLRFSGVEGELRYNFLSPAKDTFGLTLYTGLSYSVLDPHSGQDKDTLSLEQKLLVQKYFLDGQMVWVGNVGIEATRADRKAIADLPEGFDWPTDPEMELEVDADMGLSYRFAPNWYGGVEALYVQENETEVGLERWSLHGGPAIHYGGSKWWATLTWLPELRGGGEKYEGQSDQNLHLIEKTKYETRLKLGINF